MRSNVFIGEDVEAELPEALAKVAAYMGVALADAERALSRIMTRIRVVPLRIGDYLNPRIAAVRRCDPGLPQVMRGDPDDLGTAAVAEFLAPAVIISKDSVFNRFSLALPADRWTEEAARLLAAAGYDATLGDAAAATEVAARLLFGGITAAKNAAVRNPRAAVTAVIVAGLAGWYCHRRGWVTGEQLRAAGQQMVSAARPFAERVAAADARRNEARAALTVVEGLEPPSLEERCARHSTLGKSLRVSRADGVLRTAARPRAPPAHRLGDRTGSSALSASATTARATATAEGRSGAATPTTQMISSAVCALTTLAFKLDAARLAATAKAAGSGKGWPSSLSTRTVTSYLPGGLSMSGTVGVTCDISGARWPSPANDAPTRLPSHGKPSAAPATVVIQRRTCPCCCGERPDPGRGPDCRATTGGSTASSGCSRWHRAP